MPGGGAAAAAAASSAIDNVVETDKETCVYVHVKRASSSSSVVHVVVP